MKTQERTYGMWAVCLMAVLVARGFAADEAWPIIQQLSLTFGNSVITETTLRAMGIELAELLSEEEA